MHSFICMWHFIWQCIFWLIMQRYQIIDCFGDCIMRFNTMREAKLFKRNKPDCAIREIPIENLIEPCLF